MTDQASREGFEAWMKEHGWEITRPEHYSYSLVARDWRTWQAAISYANNKTSVDSIDFELLNGWNKYYEISKQGNSPSHNEAKYAVRNQWRKILEMCNQLQAALTHANTEMEKMRWQPIETFSKYQLDITVLLSDGKKVVAGYFRDGELSGFYYHDYPDDFNFYSFKPTHWIPLPPTPQSTNQEK